MGADPAWDTDSYPFRHGGIGLALYPLELLAEEAAPRALIPPEGMWSGGRWLCIARRGKP